jgi:hypothetical protein
MTKLGLLDYQELGMTIANHFRIEEVRDGCTPEVELDLNPYYCGPKRCVRVFISGLIESTDLQRFGELVKR